MKRFSAFFFLITSLIYLNIYFGPLVRATDSGLACPDWPLCHGKFIPEYTFQIAMEVGHRFYSGAIGLFILFGFIWSLVQLPLRRYTPLLVVTLFFLGTQVTLGALTVTKLLDPTTVNLHLLNAVILLLLSLTVAFRSKWDSESTIKEISLSSVFSPSSGNLYLVFVIGFTLFQLFMGGRVSSHYAGLACPDFPTCYGEWFPELFGTIRYQMEHRWIGYALALAVFYLPFYAKTKNYSGFAQKLTWAASAIIVLQIMIGAFNVWYKLPKLVTATHTGIGVLLLGCLYFCLLVRLYKNTERGS
jgi:cytochrome c oxidase assembly protein subunit 15